MDINFNTLIDVDIFHEYYKDGISKDFEITPSVECKELLKDYRFLFRSTPTGFNVSYSADSEDNPVIPIDYKIKLVFYLTSRNPYLLNYSNLPIDRIKNTIYYFTNYDSETSEKTTLHKNEDYVSSEDRIDLKSETFSMQVTSGENEVGVSVIDIDDTAVINESFRVNKNVSHIQINLHPFSPGKFKLLIDGEETSEFYADNKIQGKVVFGVIELFLDSDSEVPLAYEINFPLRKTYWRYNVFLKHTKTLTAENISIDIPKTETDKYGYTFADDLIKNQDDQTKIIFEKLPAEETSDSIICVPFVFSEELPLAEEPVEGIRLVKINDNSIFDNLPNPSIDSIKPEPVTGKVYSEISIYI